MKGASSSRLVLTYQESGRPLPRFSADDYVDWCVMEAIVLKVTNLKRKAAEDAREEADRKKWQQVAGVKTVKASMPEGGW